MAAKSLISRYSRWFMFMHFAWNQRSHSSHCTALWFFRQPLVHRAQGSVSGPGFKLTSPARTTRNEAASEMFSSFKSAWSLHNGGTSWVRGRRRVAASAFDAIASDEEGFIILTLWTDDCNSNSTIISITSVAERLNSRPPAIASLSSLVHCRNMATSSNWFGFRWLTCWYLPTDYLTSWLTSWLIDGPLTEDWLTTDWFTHSLTPWLIHWLSYWLTTKIIILELISSFNI